MSDILPFAEESLTDGKALAREIGLGRANPAEDCMICGVQQPPGHVEVQSPYSQRLGRVCSSHTLFEVISHQSDGFSVVVLYDDMDFADENFPREATP